MPDLSAIHFIARAITPPRRPLRFDSRFFAADVSAIAHRDDGFVGPDKELVELVWLPITEARSLDMPGITAVVLEELQDRIATGMSTTIRCRSTACCTSGSCAKSFKALISDGRRFLDIRGPATRLPPTASTSRSAMAKNHHDQSQAGFQRRYRLLLRDAQELAHHDRQTGDEEIRSGREKARRIPRIQDQVDSANRPSVDEGADGRPFFLFCQELDIRSEKGGRPERCYEEATRTAPVPAEPHGPRRCGGPEHSAGLSNAWRSDAAACCRARLLAEGNAGVQLNANRDSRTAITQHWLTFRCTWPVRSARLDV